MLNRTVDTFHYKNTHKIQLQIEMFNVISVLIESTVWNGKK